MREIILTSLLLGAAIVTPAVALAEAGAGKSGAALPSQDSGSEYWDISAQLDSGHRIFARFQITNDGPGDQNAVAVGHVILPSGRTSKFRNGRLRNRWTLAKDRMRLDIGASHLDLHRPRFRLQIDKGHVKIDLWFEATPFQRLPSQVTGSAYSVDLLALAGKSKGSLWLEGKGDPISLEGRTTLTHTISQSDEAKLAQRRVEVIAQEGAIAFYAAQFLAPSKPAAGWLAARLLDPDLKGAPVGSFSDSGFFTTSLELRLGTTSENRDKSKTGANSGYWIPHTLEFESSGPTGKVQVGESLLRVNPLEDLPAPIRWLVGRRMQPVRVWSRAKIEVTLLPSSGPEPLPHRGHGVVATSYLNPLTP